MSTEHPETTDRWGWNGDMCAVWGEAIVLGETRQEKEARAQLFVRAPGLLTENERLREVLAEAKLQIEYLHDRFKQTGSGNAVIARINEALLS